MRQAIQAGNSQTANGSPSRTPRSMTKPMKTLTMITSTSGCSTTQAMPMAVCW